VAQADQATAKAQQFQAELADLGERLSKQETAAQAKNESRSQEPNPPDRNAALESPGKPVYNAIFSPTVDGQAASLLDGKKTLVRFLIGPNNTANAINDSSAKVAATLSNSSSDVPLTLTMDCNFCVGRRTAVVKIVFHGKTQLSSEAQFHILPNLAMAQSVGSPAIVMDVRNSDTALRYNRLTINVVVKGAHSVGYTGKTGSVSLGEGPFTSDVVDRRSYTPDVVITLLPVVGKPFDIGFEAINPELRQQLAGLESGKKQIDGKKQLQVFHTQSLTSEELTADQDDAHTILQGIMDKGNEDVRRVLAKSPSGVVSLDTVDYVSLSPEDEPKVLSALMQLGDNLYTRLFLNSGSSLKHLMNILETFVPSDKHTVRIFIKTSGQAFPWQLLHLPGANTPANFWGFKYELSVEDISRSGPAVVTEKSGFGNIQASLIGTYLGADYSVQWSGQQQADHLKQMMPSTQLIPANTANKFRDGIKSNAEELQLILVYTHGSDGWALTRTPDGQLIRQQMVPTGPRLIFNQDGTFVRATDIVNLASGFDTSAGPFLRKSPVVLLNACETGILSTSDLTLPNAFTILGARAVIATEAPVSDGFALSFGNDIIDQLASGTDIASAVLRVRKKYLEKHNPLGLVYAYYSDDGIAGKTEGEKQTAMSDKTTPR
jgi:hypothetical protein